MDLMHSARRRGALTVLRIKPQRPAMVRPRFGDVRQNGYGAVQSLPRYAADLALARGTAPEPTDPRPVRRVSKFDNATFASRLSRRHILWRRCENFGLGSWQRTSFASYVFLPIPMALAKESG